MIYMWCVIARLFWDNWSDGSLYTFLWKVLVAIFVFNIIFWRLEFLLMFISNCFLNLQWSEFYRANFNLRHSSYFVPLLIAHGKHLYEILSWYKTRLFKFPPLVDRKIDLSICYVRGSLPAVEIQLKYDVAFLFSASLSLGCIWSLALGWIF